jgi:HEPN domain-containing protein
MREFFLAAAEEKASRFVELSGRFILDAKVLIKGKRWHTALYLAGYSLECILKYAVCMRNRRLKLPRQYWTHNYDVLLDAAGLRPDLEQPANAKLLSCYRHVNRLWSVSRRYATSGLTPEEVKDTVTMLEELRKWVIHQTGSRKR